MNTHRPAQTSRPRDLPGGFVEAGLNVRQVEPWLDLLQNQGGYRLSWQGESAGTGLQRLWGLGDRHRITQWLLAHPSHDTGRIRIFRVSPAAGEPPRAGARSWDSGGIFDLDLRVARVKDWLQRLQPPLWTPVSQPIDWPFGEFQVREWLTSGPEGAVLALIQRLAPPLPDGEPGDGLSHVFNSSQIVRDMDRSLRFYQALGFRLVVDHAGPLAGRGGEVLGLPAASAAETPVRLCILHPDGVVEGSVELVSFPAGPPGRDLAQHCRPALPGLNLLRFPVADLAALQSRLRAAGIEIAAGPLEMDWPPFRSTQALAVRSPDGTWLEFLAEIPQ